MALSMDDSLEIPEGVPPPRIVAAVSPPLVSNTEGGRPLDGRGGGGDDDWLQFVAAENGVGRRGSSVEEIADGWTARLGAVKQWGHAKIQWSDQQ